MLDISDARQRATEYARLRGRVLTRTLGNGTDGAVWEASGSDGEANRKTAIKACFHDRQYLTELSCYQRLAVSDVRRVCGLSVPRLVDFSGPLRVIEMTIVEPPRILDFGKACLDIPTEYPEDAMEDYENEQRDRWGSRYGDVQAVLWALSRYGIYYTDPNCDNIRFDPV